MLDGGEADILSFEAGGGEDAADAVKKVVLLEVFAWSGGQSPRWSAAAGWLDLQRDDGGIVDDGAYARVSVDWKW